jgi:hypothetical protein
MPAATTATGTGARQISSWTLRPALKTYVGRGPTYWQLRSRAGDSKLSRLGVTWIVTVRALPVQATVQVT